MDYTDDACDFAAGGTGEAVSTKYALFLPDGAPCAIALTVPKLDGASKEA